MKRLLLLLDEMPFLIVSFGLNCTVEMLSNIFAEIISQQSNDVGFIYNIG